MSIEQDIEEVEKLLNTLNGVVEPKKIIEEYKTLYEEYITNHLHCKDDKTLLLNHPDEYDNIIGEAVRYAEQEVIRRHIK